MSSNHTKLFSNIDFNRVDDNEQVEPPIKLKDALPQIIATFAINSIVVQAGINMTFSSILIPQLTESEDEHNIKLDLDSSANLASIVTISIALGALVCGSLMDRFGRIQLAKLICIPFIGAWLLIGFSRNLFMIYIARVISGFCGGLTTVALVYVSEISSPKYRGMLLCLNSVAVSSGILLTYGLNIYFRWRTIGFMFAVFSFVSFLLIAKLPESPSWIISLSKEKELCNALSSIQWIYRDRQLSTFFYHQLIENENLKSCAQQTSDDAATVAEQLVPQSRSEFKLEQQLGIQQQQIKMCRKENKILRKLLCKPQVYKPLIILVFAFLFQQFSGCYILIFYTINIFRNLSLNFSQRVNENMAVMLLGTLRLIMSVIASGASRKVHRKTLLYVSGLGMTVFIFIAAELVRRMEGSSVERNFLHAPRWSSMDINQNFHANATAIVSDMIHHHDNSTNNSRNDAYDVYDGNNEIYLFISILLYNTFAACGVMILPWTLISELYPIEVKGKMGGLTVTLAYMLMFSSVKSFPYLLTTFSMEIMLYLFAASSLAFCIFIYHFLPETYGKSLIDIENYFIKKS